MEPTHVLARPTHDALAGEATGVLHESVERRRPLEQLKKYFKGHRASFNFTVCFRTDANDPAVLP